MGAFADRVFAVAKQIPRGKVATYGQIGRRYRCTSRCALRRLCLAC